MSISAYIQFFRNLACVSKTLLPPSSPVKISPSSSFYPGVIPSSTTYLDYFIGVTQFYVVVILAFYGLRKVIANVYHLISLHEVSNRLYRRVVHNRKENTNREAFLLYKHAQNDIRGKFYQDILGGIAEIAIGLATIPLSFFSVGITFPGHPRPIYDSVLVVCIGVFYILLLMFGGIFRDITDASAIRLFLEKVKETNIEAEKNNQPLKIEDFLLFAHDSGFYRHDMIELIQLLDENYQCDYLNTSIDVEIEKLSVSLRGLVQASDKPRKAVKVLGIEFSTIDISPVLVYQRRLGPQTLYDLAYFVLNSIAGYGYFLGVIAYYFPNQALDAAVGSVIRGVVLFGLSPSEAEWWGCLAGDIAWMIEPIFVISQPFVLSYFTSSNRTKVRFVDSNKEKKDQ